MRKTTFRLSATCAALVIAAIASAQEVTTKEASSVTQTHATLTAGFASGSTANGFQFKYGKLASITDFSSHVLSSTSDPVDFAMSGAKNFYWREAKGWAENERGLSAGQESAITTTFTLTYPTAIEFDWCTDSEEDKTSFTFVVDGVATEHTVSGLQDNPNKPEFRHVSYMLPAGKHTVAWKFAKKGDTNTGGDIGILRNIHICNTTPDRWITKEATASELTLNGLYPSQDYLYRAYSIVNGDSLFSGLKQFATKEVSIGEVAVTNTTQATATVTGQVSPGDAEVERGFIIQSYDYREELDDFGKALVRSAKVPVTIKHNINWKTGNDYVYNTSNVLSDISVSFILTEPTTITFDWKIKGLYDTAAHVQFYIDNNSNDKLTATSNIDYYTKSNSIILAEGEHTLRWQYYGGLDYALSYRAYNNAQIYNLKIGTANTSDYKEKIPISSNDMQHVFQELLPNTAYTVKSYMYPTFESELGRRWYEDNMYSKPIMFRTCQLTADTLSVKNLMQGSAIIRGKVDGGDANIIAKGLQYKTADATTWSETAATGSDAELSATLKRLRPNTKYEYRSYIQAQNCDTVFSQTAAFTTLSVEALQPSVTACTQHTATIEAQVVMGDAIIYTRGLQFRKRNEAWTDYEDGGEKEAYTRKFSELAMNTMYEARTYIQPQGLDTIYSDVLSFSTKNVEAYIDSITDIYPRKATVHGRISTGDDAATEKTLKIFRIDTRGEFYFVTENPITTSDTIFTETVTGLTPGERYCFRIGVKGTTGEMVYSFVDNGVFQAPQPFSNLRKTSGTQTTATFSAIAEKLGETPEEIGYILYLNGTEDKEQKVLSYTEGAELLDFKITNLYPEQGYRVCLYCILDGVKYICNEVPFTTSSVIFDITYTDIKRTSAQMNITIDNIDAEIENLRYYLSDNYEIPDNAIFTPVNESVLLTGLTPATYYYTTLRYEVNGKEYWRWPEDMERLITGDVTLNVTYSDIRQTTATMKTIVDKGDAIVDDMQYSINGGATWQDMETTANFTGLAPDATYRPMFRWTVSGISYTYTAPAFQTKAVTVSASAEEVCQTSALISADYNTGNATYIRSGVYFNGDYLEGTPYRLTNLSPATTYSYRVYVMTEEGGTVMSAEHTFTTPAISVTTESATNISNRSAQFNGTVQCDAYSDATFGFEWKGMGNDWLADPVFTKGTRLDDGTMTLGLVSGMLEPNKDYQFRAVVKYQGKEYAGAWKNFHTELEYVFYAAQPVTLYRTDRETNSIVFCGYYIQGSEEIVKQGYEYWANGSQVKQMRQTDAAVSDGVIRVETGENMLYTLDSSVLADGTYCVRAFVQTATAIYYGETLSFGIGENVGIDRTEENKPTCVGAAGSIVFRNTEGLSCRIFNVSGNFIGEKREMQHTEHFPIQRGVYIVRFDTGETTKVIVR
ncbi:MAG: hypothetical protein NC206_05840 [Bacteroides sp.]|nr:hypothetical protein [Roseburia sp.]MCM1346588.1 hypothetical protein [Bacteroides sp.]MCM1421398.1 hypothetical protein [Bacteroides sp.]